MSKKQLILLFLCNLVPFTVGSGLVPLLPVYASRLGADPALTGYYLSFTFFALAVSTMVAGRLADWLQHRKALLVICAALSAPATWLTGQATTIVELIIFNAVLWFVGGIVVAMVNILAGLSAEEHERGRVFGIINLAIPLGGVLGGLVAGRIVDRSGFPALLTVFSLLYLLVPVIGAFVTDRAPTNSRQQDAATRSGGMLNRTFFLLFIASVLVYVANSEFALARTLIMDQSAFDATAISSTAVVGGLLAFPLPPLMGWLSDRLGRKPLLIVCYLVAALGLLVLAFASSLWHFWLATVLQFTLNAALAVGSALVTDLVPRETLGRALALFSATTWIGFVVGFGGGGTLIQTIGMTSSLLVGTLFTGVAIVLALMIRRPALHFQAAPD